MKSWGNHSWAIEAWRSYRRPTSGSSSVSSPCSSIVSVTYLEPRRARNPLAWNACRPAPPYSHSVLKMAVGHSDDVDLADAIAAVIAQCRAALDGLSPQAGILFAAYDSFDRSVVDAVLEAFPGVQVIGGTSAAEVSSVSGYREDSITLSLFASDDVDITVGLAGGLADDVDAACHAAASQALSGTTKDPKLCLLLTEGLARGPQLVLAAR